MAKGNTRQDGRKTRANGHRSRIEPGRWDAVGAIREATAGALQALGVMSSFVIFGLGWAMLAGASPHSSAPSTEPIHQCSAESGIHEAASTDQFRADITGNTNCTNCTNYTNDTNCTNYTSVTGVGCVGCR